MFTKTIPFPYFILRNDISYAHHIFPTAAEYMDYYTSCQCLLFVFKVTGTLQLRTVESTSSASADLQLHVETEQGDPQLDEHR